MPNVQNEILVCPRCGHIVKSPFNITINTRHSFCGNCTHQGDMMTKTVNDIAAMMYPISFAGGY